MPKGGRREGGGRKPSWKNGKTKNIKVPIVLAEDILKIARELDEKTIVLSPSNESKKSPLPSFLAKESKQVKNKTFFNRLVQSSFVKKEESNANLFSETEINNRVIELISNAEQLEKEGKFKEAIKLFDEALELKNKNFEVSIPKNFESFEPHTDLFEGDLELKNKKPDLYIPQHFECIQEPKVKFKDVQNLFNIKQPTLSYRIKALGLITVRKGRNTYLTYEQIALLDKLNTYLKDNPTNTIDDFLHSQSSKF